MQRPLRALLVACLAAGGAAQCSTGSGCCDLTVPTCAGCCASVTSLALSGDTVPLLPRELLWGLPALTSVGIFLSTATTLPAGFLANATLLQVVNMQGTLSSLPANFFAAQARLTNLNIQYNQLSTLDSSVFNGLAALTSLDMSYARLTSLPARVFCPLVSLTSLGFRVASNWNGSSTPPTISCLPNLDYLAIPDSTYFGATSGTSAIPAGYFAGNTRLARLDAYYNAGASAASFFPPGTFAWNPLLSTINIGHSAPFPASAFCIASNSTCCDTATSPIFCSGCCSGMTALDLSSRGLTSRLLPSGLFTPYTPPNPGLGGGSQSWSTLAALSLRNNSLARIDAAVFSPAPPLLASVDLRGNAAMPPACDAVFPSLAAVAAAGCLCSTAPASCCSVAAGVANCSGCCSWTAAIDLSSAGVTSLPAAVFQGFTALTQLRLGGNAITALPAGVFASLSALQELYLGGNAFATLPASVFAGLSALRLIDLTGSTALTTLPARLFANLSSLASVSLDDTRYAVLPDSTFEGSTALTSLSLGNNPYLLGLPPALLTSLPLLANLHLGSDSALAAFPAGFFPARWLSNQGGAYQLYTYGTAMDQPGQPQCSCNCNPEGTWSRLAQASCFCSLAAASCCDMAASPPTCAGCCRTTTALDLSGLGFSSLPLGLFSSLPLLSSLSRSPATPSCG